jgi:hypothetical protein
LTAPKPGKVYFAARIATVPATSGTSALAHQEPMNIRRALYALLCLGAAVLAGCNTGNGVGALPINTTVRVVNLVPNAPPITFSVDGTPLVTGLAFEQQTLYLDTSEGSHEFTVTDGGNSTLVDVTETLTNGQANTFVVFGPQDAASSQLLVDTPITIPQNGTTVTLPQGGTFAVRLTNLAEGVGAVDMYLTAPGADLAFTAPTIIGVAVGVITAYVPVTTGSYEVRFALNGTKNVIFDTGTVVPFGDQSIVEAVTYSKGSSKLVGLDILTVNTTQGAAQIYQNLLAQFKLVNASSVGPPLNVLVDGALILTNVPFAGVSNYVKTLAKTQTLSIESTATPGASLLTFTADFSPATDSSIVVSGPAGALQELVLTDNNMPSPTGRARVRFVNASPGLPSLDVYVNFVPTFADVLSNTASAYTELVANVTGSTFNIGFNTAGTTTPVLTLPKVTFVAGTTYTVYVVGSASAPQGVVVSDNLQ